MEFFSVFTQISATKIPNYFLKIGILIREKSNFIKRNLYATDYD